MILINLLPHREMARRRARQRFNLSLGLALLAGAAVAAGIGVARQAEIDRQQQRNAVLAAEIGKLEQEIKEVANLQAEIAALQARQSAVQNLQADRNLPVHLLNEAVGQLPDGVVLRSIKQDSQAVLLAGAAQSSERVSELLRRLSRQGDRVVEPELVEIVAASLALGPKEQRRVYNFVVRAQLKRADDETPASPASAPAAGQR